MKGLIADQLAEYGADKVIVVDDPELKDYQNRAVCTCIGVCDQRNIKPEIMLVGATAIGRDLGPTVSARVATGLTADCTQLRDRRFPDQSDARKQKQKHNQLTDDPSGIRRKHDRNHCLPG